MLYLDLAILVGVIGGIFLERLADNAEKYTNKKIK